MAKTKTFVLISVLVLIAVLSTVNGLDGYPSANSWQLQKQSYLLFDQQTVFLETPHLGNPYDNSLVGYWSLDEGSGTKTQDNSGHYNDGEIAGCNWVDGKFGKALSFNNNNQFVDLGNSLTLNPSKTITISAWVELASSPTPYQRIITRRNGVAADLSVYSLEFDYSGLRPVFWVSDGSTFHILTSNTQLKTDVFYNIVGVYDGSKGQIFINGNLDSSMQLGDFSINSLSTNTYLGRDKGGYPSVYFNGIIDDLCLYNRNLDYREVSALYTMGSNAHPNPNSYADYFVFVDSKTHNVMLINSIETNADAHNVSLIRCKNFFSNSTLLFQANTTINVNIWTNLGKPTYSKGIWNPENCTTTLKLDVLALGELNWNAYNITTYTDSHSTVSPANVSLPYKGSLTFNFSASQGYSLNVFVDGLAKGKISEFTFSDVLESHSINVTSEAVNSVLNPQTNPVLLQVGIIAGVLLIILIVVVIAFKKGYVRVEVINKSSEKNKT